MKRVLPLASMVLFAGGWMSSASVGAPQVEMNIPYVVRDGTPLRADIYSPAAHTSGMKTPAVLVIHGGGWCGGSKADLAPAAKALANAGFVAVCIDYRLASANGNKFPAQLDDVQTAVRWLRANAQKYGIDPQRIGAVGHSAGGQLAALLGTEDTRDNSDAALAEFSSRVQAVVDVSGPTLFVGVPEASISQQAMWLLINFFGKPPMEAITLSTLASPALHVDGKTAPTLIVHGTADDLVPLAQAQLFYDALKEKGRDATLMTLSGEGHNYSPAGLTKWGHAAIAFFQKHLE